MLEALTSHLMMLSAFLEPLQFPFQQTADYDPRIAIKIPTFFWDPLPIRWYSLAYVGGVIAGWRIMLHLARKPGAAFNEEHANEFPTWVVFGLMLGARLGYVLFYKPMYYLENPADIFMVWHGGMSFHGGLIGIGLVTFMYARARGLPLGALTDVVVSVSPIGLFFGRLANFVNGELWGRTTDSAFGMVGFPNVPPDTVGQPRHPSQLYEAAFEGVALFVVVNFLRSRFGKNHRYGWVSGIFLIGYGLARSSAELFRQPDRHIGEGGFLAGGVTMGQILSVPMILAGVVVMLRCWPKPGPGEGPDQVSNEPTPADDATGPAPEEETD